MMFKLPSRGVPIAAAGLESNVKLLWAQLRDTHEIAGGPFITTKIYKRGLTHSMVVYEEHIVLLPFHLPLVHARKPHLVLG